MEVYGYHFRDSLLLHRDAKQHIRKFHCALVMRDDDNLRIFTDDLQKVVETENIGIIQGRVYLVKQTKGCRLYQKNRKNKRNGRQGLFAAGEQAEAGQFLAGRMDHQLDSGFQRFIRFDEDQLGLTAIK